MGGMEEIPTIAQGGRSMMISRIPKEKEEKKKKSQ